MFQKIKKTQIGHQISFYKRVILSTISPEFATKQMYKNIHGKKLNLEHPLDLNEKLQYLKLRTYYNNPIITKCADKYKIREYLSSIGCGEILPKLIAGAFYKPVDIRQEWDKLPDKFVVKCNHGCGYNILVSDKSKANLEDIIDKLTKWMKEDFWKRYCEPQYKYIKKAIIIEEYLGDDIATYKFYCFNGKPEVMYISSNGENGEKDLYLDYYDMNMNWVNITLAPHKHAKVKANKPNNWIEMVNLVTELANPFPFVRIDLYNVNEKIYISEFTFIPTGGNMELEPAHYINDWGELLELK